MADIARTLVEVACAVTDIACRVTDVPGLVIETSCNIRFATPGFCVMPERNPVSLCKCRWVVTLLSGMLEYPVCVSYLELS
jgi:hypothetical protein